MAWIKRNLYFVITVVVGLGLTGYCVYLLLAAVSDNAAAKTTFDEATNNLIQLQNSRPFPSPENIHAAEADAERVKSFKGEFLKAFYGFPTPPKMDDHLFKDYLQKTINKFGAEATNAGVNMNAGYAFGFGQQQGKYIYPAECINPWMQELEEMEVILHVLYSAKINFLEHIKRPLVSPNDQSDDYIQLSTVTNANGVVTPYRLEFRAFSSEIANVLAGFAASSNCIIVKAPLVEKSTVQLPDLPPPPTPQPVAPPVFMRPRLTEFPSDQPPTGRGMRGERPIFRPQPVQPTQVVPVPTGPTPPVTILREKPLFVTLYVEVVKLKALETNSAASAPRARTGAR